MELPIISAYRTSCILRFVSFLFALSGCTEGGGRDDLLSKIDSVETHFNEKLDEESKKIHLAIRHNSVKDTIEFQEYIILSERKYPIITKNGTRNGKYCLRINVSGVIEEVKTNELSFRLDSSIKEPYYKFKFKKFDFYLDRDKINDSKYLKEYFERFCSKDKIDVFGYVSNVIMYSRDQMDFKIRIYDSLRNERHKDDELIFD